MNRPQREMLEDLRRRLEGRSWLSDDGQAYRAGVDDALDEIERALDADVTAESGVSAPTG